MNTYFVTFRHTSPNTAFVAVIEQLLLPSHAICIFCKAPAALQFIFCKMLQLKTNNILYFTQSLSTFATAILVVEKYLSWKDLNVSKRKNNSFS